MTNHWQDMKNTDVALICGSNAAENHPVSFSWLTEAREKRGAKIIHVDPRFTRTSARSDLYCPIRSGSNLIFYSGMINYILENDRMHRDYVLHYTNATFVIKEGFAFDDVTGLFTGYDEAVGRYTDRSTWDYERDEDGNYVRDMTLNHPRSVYQIMKNHYSRYTLEKTAAAAGAPVDKLEQVYELFTSTGETGKAGSILYAMGQTQFTSGAQNVRALGLIQLLLGNLGIPGGGTQALRGHSNVQGSTDMACLFHILPGYLPAPNESLATLEAYNATTPAAPAWWSNRPKYIASLLKAWWGDSAQADNDFHYGWLPKGKAGKDYSHISVFEGMHAEEVKGLISWGQNPVVAGPHYNFSTKAMENLDWLVVLDPFENETAAFWKRPGANPRDIQTEVFLLPPTTFLEKEGSVTHSGRLMQYRWKAVEGPGDVKQESYILDRLAKRLKALYASSTRPEDEPIKAFTWNYPDPAVDHRAFIDAVTREISGRNLTTGLQVNLFTELQDDGTTDCGNWIYSGCYTEALGNRSQRRGVDDPGGWGAYLDWGFAWPANRRILYNRASVDPNGRPWSEDREYMRWSASTGWSGYDVVDGGAPLRAEDGSINAPFIMLTEQVGRLFAIGGLNDGPLPEHYEPWESPTENVFNGRQTNPAHYKGAVGSSDEYRSNPSEYPIICSTWRVCEHWHSGATSRHMPWLAELMPASFVEMSEDLAAEKGIVNGETVEIVNARGSIKAVAMVTPRNADFNINGNKTYQVGLTWHFGFKGLVTGDVANALTPHVGDANTSIPEYKAFLVDVRKVR
ncbi:formate dehydrogenase-N subunit alpha [Desulfuribacillus alkaliarsenatis]|uniref:Formate dehydrogenase-N subunit alpha n=3 Tax=Desulfuribacillus alkaliarsenatis TaxID=766136 RepID=A0A1E5FZI7_9FIRM|nr:formate dehydrogenase-N subunit alpha [Desulfuribacillus alkaliarsenatis]